MAKVGVVDLESFFPAKDRFALAMSLNNLLAAPGFASWLEGEPLEVGSILRTPAGKPRVAIFSIAHLSDAERMFFVTLLLNQTLAWMRAQSGTTSLRAILYMDEIAGYFPPVATPPAKAPLLTLLKQGRAFGLGVVLATQNPVDLDYKGLANTGTWFLGRLQTERDKARVLEGLEGAAASASQKFDRGRMEQTLAGARQPRVPAQQRARGRARGVRDALGALLPARPADARPDQDADGPEARGGDRQDRGRGRRRSPRPSVRRPAAGPSAGRAAALRSGARGRGRDRLPRRPCSARPRRLFLGRKARGLVDARSVARVAPLAELARLECG